MFHKVLAAYFGFFAVFWFLGIDQFYFGLFCLIGFMTHMTAKRSPQTAEVLLFGIFVITTIISAVQINTGFRFVTYLRNEGVYLAMFFVLLSTSFVAAQKKEITDRIYFVLFIFSLQCTLVSFLASSGYNISFKSLGAHVIPDLGSKYIYGMLNKSSIQSEAAWFSDGFNRPRGLMLYANTMAGVLCASMAIKAYFALKYWSERKQLITIICVVAILMDAFSVYSALSRSTWLGFVFALAVFPFMFKSSLPAKFIPAVVGVLAIALVFATGFNEGIQARLTDKGHSNEGRGLNYTLVWQMTTSQLDTFFIGHGTQLDHPAISVPVGSHSTYIGMFFKFGVIGLTVFLVFLFVLYRRMLSLTRNIHELNRQGHNITRPYFVCFGLIVLLVQMTFIEVDVDASYAMFVAVLMYLVIQESKAVKDMLEQTRPPSPPQPPTPEQPDNIVAQTLSKLSARQAVP